MKSGDGRGAGGGATWGRWRGARHWTWTVVAVALATVLTLILAPLLLARPAPAASEPDETATQAGTAAADTAPPAPAVHVRIYGDTISQGASPRLFSQGYFGPGSWADHLGEIGLAFDGGAAKSGATPQSLLREGRVRSLPAASQITFAFLGTNNVRRAPAGKQAEAFKAYVAALDTIRARAKAPDSGFAVALVGPMDDRPAAEIAAWNRRVKAVAARRGWIVVDPFTGLRGPGNHWVAGMHKDVLHPNAQGAAVIAQNVGRDLTRAAAQRER